jgi:ribosomal protein L7Ae-like RNA K-turn-binding protein
MVKKFEFKHRNPMTMQSIVMNTRRAPLNDIHFGVLSVMPMILNGKIKLCFMANISVYKAILIIVNWQHRETFSSRT